MGAEEIITKTILIANDVHWALSPGYLECVYRKAMMIMLKEAGMVAVEEYPIKIHFHGQLIGDYRADIFIENKVIVELKAQISLSSANEAQLVNYLTATGIDHGLLINFGEHYEIKRKFRIYRPKNRP